MNLENLEYLKEALKYRGFPEELNEVLERYVKKVTPEFELACQAKKGEDDMAYKLHFTKHNKYDFYYFNKFEATLKEKGQTKSKVHTFYPDQNITAKEAYNLLKFGEKTAVHKSLFNKDGKRYKTWITLDLSGEKDQHGNYPVQKYHENYYAKHPFRLSEAIEALSVQIKDLGHPDKLDLITGKLKKGTPVQVTFSGKEEDTTGYLMVNAKDGRIEAYDAGMQLITLRDHKPAQREEQDDTAIKVKATASASAERRLKKKPWQNQRISGRRNLKGHSIR